MHQINKSVTALSYLQVTQISAILLYAWSNDLLYPRLEAKAHVFILCQSMDMPQPRNRTTTHPSNGY